jgi:hypothetical protein
MASQMEALGMIETKGLVCLIEAVDAMLKSANVRSVGWDKSRQRPGDGVRGRRRGRRQSRHRCRCQRRQQNRRSRQRASDSSPARRTRELVAQEVGPISSPQFSHQREIAYGQAMEKSTDQFASAKTAKAETSSVPKEKQTTMSGDAIGLIETKGLIAQFEACGYHAESRQRQPGQTDSNRRGLCDDGHQRRRRFGASRRRCRRRRGVRGRRTRQRPRHPPPGTTLIESFL